jgi:predicted nucleotidyltransferase
MSFAKGNLMVVQTVHEKCLAKSAILSRYQMPQVIPLEDVIRVLNQAKVRFVLVGAHGLAGWRNKPRATEDVDVIVAQAHLKKAVKALENAYPHLEPVDRQVVIRMQDRESHDVLIDVMKPVQQPYTEAFKHTHTTTIDGQKVRIPTLEMALVMKFSAMISPNRPYEDKLLDAHDFMHMVKSNPPCDVEKLTEIGSLMYPDGGKDVVEMVRKVRAGEKLEL